ncbi:MAG: hypothetical protein AMXMBFR83_06340 [Phycisphaerae bacterium]
MAVGIMVAGTGCTQPTQPVVTNLPDPYTIEPAPYSPPPTPRIEQPRPEPPAARPWEGWLPPGGIRRRWNAIIIHHTDSEIGSFRDIDQWHRNGNGWEHGCGYHFVIGNGSRSGDGQVEPSTRWRQQIIGAHTRLAVAYARKKGVPPNYYNENGIGIVLVGNFNRTQPSPRQMRSLVQLVSFLMNQCQIPESRIYTHGGAGGVDQTECPGRNFSLYQFKLMLRGQR